jgi:peptide/nickel transport system ATP-binding protein
VTQAKEPLLEIEHLTKYFPVRTGLLQRETARVHAVEDVSLTVYKGETLGLVGESGCGKSTLGRTMVRLLEPTAGTIRFDGQEITKLSRRRLRPLRRELQMVFQDPYASLNPRKRVGTIVGDPLAIHGIGTRHDRRSRVQELLATVGLAPEHFNRFPHEFSGGQRQRIGVARALALRPKLIVADEPVSALDVSIQAQIVNLFEELQDEFGLTYVFIAHDLNVVRHVSDRVAVMYLGSLVEISPAEDLYANPLHPYTISLLEAVPIPDPEVEAKREVVVLPGELPSPVAPPSGCRFHTRCPYRQPTRCHDEPPPLRPLGERGHMVACHWAEDVQAGRIQPRYTDPADVPEDLAGLTASAPAES